MDCKNLGIGLIVLSITLFLGVKTSEILDLKEIPEIEVAEDIIDSLHIESSKNCKPKEKDLKYQTLLWIEKEKKYKEIAESKLPELTPLPATLEDKKQTAERLKKETARVLEGLPMDSRPPLGEENLSKNETLVHKEICREKENGRKDGAKIDN